MAGHRIFDVLGELASLIGVADCAKHWPPQTIAAVTLAATPSSRRPHYRFANASSLGRLRGHFIDHGATAIERTVIGAAERAISRATDILVDGGVR